MILGISMIAVSEAFVLGEKLGLSHQALFDVASASSGQCWSLTSYCPVPGPVPASPANNDYKPGFAAALMLKDLKLAREAAQSVQGKYRARYAGGRDLRALRAGRSQRCGFLRDHQARPRAGVEHHGFKLKRPALCPPAPRSGEGGPLCAAERWKGRRPQSLAPPSKIYRVAARPLHHASHAPAASRAIP